MQRKTSKRRHLYEYCFHQSNSKSSWNAHTIQKVLRDHLSCRSLRICILHDFKETDRETRLKSAHWFLKQDPDDKLYSPHIMWTNEAHSTDDGSVCSQQCITWSKKRSLPQVTKSRMQLHDWYHHWAFFLKERLKEKTIVKGWNFLSFHNTNNCNNTGLWREHFSTRWRENEVFDSFSVTSFTEGSLNQNFLVTAPRPLVVDSSQT